MSEARDKLTLEQKRNLYHDGFLVLKKVIPDEFIDMSFLDKYTPIIE